MEHLNITKKHLDFFKGIIKKYYADTNFPEKHNWKQLNNNDLWEKMVIQIMVVGGSDGANRYSDKIELKTLIKYDTLLKNDDYGEIAKTINYVLRKAGIRYASVDITKCNKTKALVHNFKILKKSKKGFTGILEKLSQFEGLNADIRRVKYLMKIFSFIKSKSARDFLMNMGICNNTIAIDIRIQNIFKKANLQIPNTVMGNEIIYDQIEKEIVNKICNHLKIEPVKLDRILYQNYDTIMGDERE